MARIDNVPEEEQPPEPPVDRMERIERVLEGLIGVVNQQARNNQPPLIHEPHRDGLMSIKDFQKMKPPIFEGGIDPSKADYWELGMEKIFAVVNPAQCSEVHKVVLATYNFEGEAHRWWVQQRGREPNMTWAQFLEVFHEKYYPQTIRDSKASEFSELRHRNCLSVAGYDKKFTELSQFAPHMVATDALRAQRFEEGLNDELRPQVKMLRLQTYADVLNVSLMLESELAKVNGKSGGQQVKRTNYLPSVDKKGNNSFKKRNTNMSGWNQGSGSGSGGNNSGALLCPKCGRFHRGQCYRDMGACFNCGGMGHFMRDCPKLAKAGAVKPAAMTNSRQGSGVKFDKGKIQQARAFALTPGDSQNANSVVLGTLQICGHLACVLIDSGSTRSFVSTRFATKLTRPLEPLGYELLVSQPMSSSISCSTVYKACDILVGGVHLLVDLIPLNMGHFDAILGMDWLSSNFATIDCITKRVMLPIPGKVEITFEGKGVVPPPYLISAMCARRLLNKGCWGYSCSVLTTESGTTNLEDIPVVNEFPDVFPEELPGSLVDREIEFGIDLIPGTQPISNTPYIECHH